jgi:hypothetical protein
MVNHMQRQLLPGDIVEVRSWSEIAATLDESGMLEDLPFMAEMLQFCGQRFTVSRRVERTCDETTDRMRGMRKTVFLNSLRCDGSGHGGCQKGCMIFWKERWLRKVLDPTVVEAGLPEVAEEVELPWCKPTGDDYICQATELVNATSPLSLGDLGRSLRNLLAATSLLHVGRLLAIKIHLRLWRMLRGESYVSVKGPRDQTPVEVLDLQPGDWIRVKSQQEIVATLDRRGKNRGMAFTAEMIVFCGQHFRVLKRLERMINEETRNLIEVKNTVILENVACDGCHKLLGPCPRANFYFWREAWLQRLEGRP